MDLFNLLIVNPGINQRDILDQLPDSFVEELYLDFLNGFFNSKPPVNSYVFLTIGEGKENERFFTLI